MNIIGVNYKNFFLSSDSHYGHFNIIQWSKRPFSSSAVMTETLIKNWNERIEKKDIVVHCGDLSLSTNVPYLKDILYRLNGKIHLVAGNHDKWLKHEDLRRRFESVSDMLQINVQTKQNKTQTIIACHFPIYRWHKSHCGSWHVYGHTHQKEPLSIYSNTAVNVGVDAWNYYPVAYEEIEKLILENSNNKNNSKVPNQSE